MSENFGSSGQIQPLSIGNVVSAAVRLYRSHLKTYLKLALIAHLWIIVPIYGWAKYAAISGLISRLAFGELIYQPESVQTASSHVNPRLWSFLSVGFQVGISMLLIYLGLAIVGGVVASLLGLVLRGILGTTGAIVATTLAIIVTVVIVLLGLTWFYSRWVVAEVPLAVEENINSGESVARSWELTKASVFRIQGVVLVAFIVTLPLVFVLNYIPNLFLLKLEQGSTIYWIVYVISLIGSLVGGIFVMPFWQALKAVLYLDLRSRREGLGLQLREPPSPDFR
ncbi:MAG: glycerophosphoryl diester phosphodiesterase membrane domain-containing protein [Nostoc sp.]|uniref:glycerophosphoryl diester phosphodiesterase membrane domain-containing protein n=1 Tax=Nostoc sp. TaxID=1180 RepID=UPI002FF6DB9B